MIYNPLAEPIERELRLPLYYTGLSDKALIVHEDGRTEKLVLSRDYTTTVKIKVPAKARTWVVVKAR
jgi:hypothetical protein